VLRVDEGTQQTERKQSGWKWGDPAPAFPGVVTDRMKEIYPHAVAGLECDCLSNSWDCALIVTLAEGDNGRWFIGGDAVDLKDGIAYDAWYDFDEFLTEEELDEGFPSKEAAIAKAKDAWDSSFD